MKINKEIMRRSIQKAKEQIFKKNTEGLSSSIHRRFSNVSMDKNKSKNIATKHGEMTIIGTNNLHSKHNFADSNKRSNLNKTINAEKIYNRRMRYPVHNPSIKIEKNLNKTQLNGKILSLINSKVSENINQTMRLYEAKYNKDIKYENGFFDLKHEKASRNNQIIKQKTLNNPSKR